MSSIKREILDILNLTDKRREGTRIEGAGEVCELYSLDNANREREYGV